MGRLEDREVQGTCVWGTYSQENKESGKKPAPEKAEIAGRDAKHGKYDR